MFLHAQSCLVPRSIDSLLIRSVSKILDVMLAVQGHGASEDYAAGALFVHNLILINTNRKQRTETHSEISD